MARKTNAQLLVELEGAKAAAAAAQARADEAEAAQAADRAAFAEHSLHVTEGSDVFGGEDDFNVVLGSEGEVLEPQEDVPAWAQALLAQNATLSEEVAELKTRKSRKAKTPVGQREGDVTIRNITSRLVRVRLGNQSDPYRIELQPKGRSGDVADVPGSLVGTTQFKRNVNRVFEVVTADEAAAIDYSGQSTRQFPIANLISEAERIVARQEIDPRTGLPIQPMQQARERGGPVGPRIAAAPGSDNVLFGLPEGTDPEYAQFLAWKAAQGTLGAPMNAGPRPPGGYEPGSQQGVSLLTRLEQAAQSGDQEAGAMARKLRAAAAKGVIPEGELDKPLRVTHATVSVQPNVIY